MRGWTTTPHVRRGADGRDPGTRPFLERIRSHLDQAGVPVSIATLSYWQSGRSLPTRARSFHTRRARTGSRRRGRPPHPAHLHGRWTHAPRDVRVAEGRAVARRRFRGDRRPRPRLARRTHPNRRPGPPHDRTRSFRTGAGSAGHLAHRAVGPARWAVVSEQDAQGATSQTVEPLMGCASARSSSSLSATCSSPR